MMQCAAPCHHGVPTPSPQVEDVWRVLIYLGQTPHRWESAISDKPHLGRKGQIQTSVHGKKLCMAVKYKQNPFHLSQESNLCLILLCILWYLLYCTVLYCTVIVIFPYCPDSSLPQSYCLYWKTLAVLYFSDGFPFYLYHMFSTSLNIWRKKYVSNKPSAMPTLMCYFLRVTSPKSKNILRWMSITVNRIKNKSRVQYKTTKADIC